MKLKKMDSAIDKAEASHYFEVRDLNGDRYCHCGIERDAKNICEMHLGFTYEKLYLPKMPRVINVPYVKVAPDFELPMQQILPESDLQPIKLDL